MPTVDETFLTTPIASDNPQQGFQNIQDTRAAFAERMAKEHSMVENGTDGQAQHDGYHLPGSAVVFFGTHAPTVRPDGTTLEAGRLWLQSGTVLPRLYCYDGANWNIVSPLTGIPASITAGTLATASLVIGAGYWIVHLDTDLGDGVNPLVGILEAFIAGNWTLVGQAYIHAGQPVNASAQMTTMVVSDGANWRIRSFGTINYTLTKIA